MYFSFFFSTSYDSFEELLKRMLIICQKKKRRRERSPQRRWKLLDLFLCSLGVLQHSRKPNIHLLTLESKLCNN